MRNKDPFDGHGTEYMPPGRDFWDAAQWHTFPFQVCWHSFGEECNDKCGIYDPTTGKRK